MGKKVKGQNVKRLPVKTPSPLPLQKNYFWLAGVLIITFVVFFPAIKNQLISFDDIHYISDNLYIKSFSLENLRAIFLTDANNLGNYHPLTLLSFAANYALSGLEPTGYHLTNVLLHLVNTLLVFQLSLLLFARIGSDHKLLLSSITALLFGIHPLHIESVAWVSGRKDLLYTCFYLLSLIFYLRYLDKKSIPRYLLSLLFFGLSLLSKGMAVTLSLCVVAIDYLLKRDFSNKRVLLEKVPFFILSIFFGIIAILVQQAQGATEIIKFGVFDRIIFASYGFSQYLVKIIFPYTLCGYYPYPDLVVANIPDMYYLSLFPVVLTILILVYLALVRPRREIVFGILFFILNVILVLQLFPVGSAVMADRYTYLSSFGAFFLIALGIGFLIKKLASYRLILAGICLSYLLVLSVISTQRCAVWHDSYSFWNDVMLKYPKFYPAINNLGELNETDGNTQEAFQLYNNSIKASQNNPNAWFHRGSIYGKSGKYQEAISDFGQAIRYYPGFFTQAYINRAIAKSLSLDYHGALADLDSVIGNRKNESAYFNRGILKNELKEYSQAISDFQEAINLNPSCTRCYYSLGLANYNAGFFPEAIKAFTTRINLDPANGHAYFYRALSNVESGEPRSSCSDLQTALKLGLKEAEPFLTKYCRQ